MSFDHKAFAFDWDAFEDELLPLVRDAVASSDPASLLIWCNARRSELTDPYEGGALVAEWDSSLENGDSQEIADFALTKFYDVTADFGLGAQWADLDARIDTTARAALLGRRLTFGNVGFDPGRMGSYFQDPGDAKISLLALREETELAVADFRAHLERECVARNLGLYVTF
jgi:hypothetical protein